MGDTQWQELTGDPDVLSVQAAKYQQVAEAIHRSTPALSSIANESETISEAMTALRTLAGELLADINQALVRYGVVGDTLTHYPLCEPVAVGEGAG